MNKRASNAVYQEHNSNDKTKLKTINQCSSTQNTKHKNSSKSIKETIIQPHIQLHPKLQLSSKKISFPSIRFHHQSFWDENTETSKKNAIQGDKVTSKHKQNTVVRK
jgi:hypothetical protein